MVSKNIMQTVGIKDLQVNPAQLTRAIEANEYTLITKRNKPIGLTLSLNDQVITNSLKTALMLDAYKKGYLSLGQLANALKKDKQATMQLLGVMGEAVIDYDFADDLEFIENYK